MFDRLDDLLIRYEELLEELNSPDVAMDQNRFRKLMKEQADLTPLVDAYKEYKKANQDVEDSLALDVYKRQVDNIWEQSVMTGWHRWGQSLKSHIIKNYMRR